MVKVNQLKIRLLTEEEYLNILDTLPADNQYLMILIQICCQNGSRMYYGFIGKN
jgi:hypothetical protein